MELSEIFAALGAHVMDEATDGEEPQVSEAKVRLVAQDMRKKEVPAGVKALVLRFLTIGAGRGKGEVTTRLTAAESDVERLTNELEDAKAALEAAQGIPSEREAELTRQIEKLKKDKATAERERDDAKGEAEQGHVSRAVDRFERALQGRIKPYGIGVEVHKHRDRIRLGADKKSVLVLPPGEDTPYEVEAGQDPVELLADDVVAQVPAEYRIAPVKPGGGSGAGDLSPDGKPATPEENKKKLRRTGAY